MGLRGNPGCNGLRLFPLVFLVVAAPGLAVGQTNLCIAPLGSQPTVCEPTVLCDAVFTSFADASADAAARIASLGPQPVTMCVTETVGVAERVVLDNTGGRLGSPLIVEFGSSWVCPPSSAAPGEPAIDFTGQAGDRLQQPRVSFGSTDCVEAARPGVRVSGSGTVAVTRPTLTGTVGYGINIDSPALSVGELSNLQVRACSGSALVSSSTLQLAASRIVGCSTTGTALVAMGTGADLDIHTSLFAGNRIDTAAGAMIEGSVDELFEVAFAANLLEGVPIARPRILQQSIFSRNVSVSDLESIQVPAPPPAEIPFGSIFCIDEGLGDWLTDIVAPPATGSGPLIEAGLSNGSTAGVRTFARNSFIENAVVGGGLVALDRPWSGAVYLLHNTFAGNSAALLIDVGELTTVGAVALFNNLADGTVPIGAFGLEPVVGGRFDVGNVGPSTLVWTPKSEVAVADIRVAGASSEPEWVDPGDLPFGPCALHQLLCPYHDSAACDGRAQAEHPVRCPIDRAAYYMADASWVASLGDNWPYDETVLGGSVGTAGFPGVQGWGSCDVLGLLGDVDGDSYPNAIDCNDSDPNWIPVVPDDPEDPWCVDMSRQGDDDDSGDDDDTTTADDDDASGVPDDDDHNTADDDDTSDLQVPVGCTGRGCGAALPVYAALIAVPSLALRRRRR